jgi:hypothetical protein
MPRFTGLRGPQHGEQDRGQDPCNTDQNRKLIMDKRWQRLPGSRTEPAGLERKVLARLPMIALAGTAACMAVALFARLLWWGDDSLEVVRSLSMIDIWVLAAVVLHWTVVFTVAIGAFIVFVMKGPAYVADPYDLPDEDAPR